ncbi:MAG TPA: cytochrome c4 [Burkholderiaceae bacterium]
MADFSIRRVLLRLAGCALLLSCSAGWAQPAQDPMAQRLAACVACHGAEGRVTTSGFFPPIAGKPAGYLYNQLVNFRDGRRHYPLMTNMVSLMSDQYLLEIATYFSTLRSNYPAPMTGAPASTLERGKVLALNGDKARALPACAACHGPQLSGVLPAIPSLLGLPRDYLVAQIGSWKTGSRRAASPDCMAHISKSLSAEDIGAVSTWLASQPLSSHATPVQASAVQLPLPCGTALK